MGLGRSACLSIMLRIWTIASPVARWLITVIVVCGRDQRQGLGGIYLPLASPPNQQMLRKAVGLFVVLRFNDCLANHLQCFWRLRAGNVNEVARGNSDNHFANNFPTELLPNVIE